ncbi:DgyrCDS13235 [Dimorphilus gyrociliatus]|uniref:DgyrCDS13235 n=1 Tax=Dimorphilus gyrociliatus TaxID=2664684 RepID=A0A7I8WA27_9ANNE|nr:DgyrCDS13235 [Dimorphilus gyrociliatus]
MDRNPVQYEGNYLILDEPETNRGVQETYSSQSDCSKRPSFFERLTAVRNHKCDVSLGLKHAEIESAREKSMKSLQDRLHRINYDLRSLQVATKVNEMKTIKEKDPKADLIEDEKLIAQSMKYLDFNPNNVYYLSKTLKIPIRTVLDTSTISPQVAKARNALRMVELEEQLREIKERLMAQAEIKRRLELNDQEEEEEADKLPEIAVKTNESRQEIDKLTMFNLPSLIEVEEPSNSPPRPYRMHTTIVAEPFNLNLPKLEKSHTIIGLLQEYGEQKALDESSDDERGTPDPQAPTDRSEIYDKLKSAGIVPQEKHVVPKKHFKKRQSRSSRRPSSMLSSFKERPTAHSIKRNEQVIIQNKVDTFFMHLERSTGTSWSRRIVIDEEKKGAPISNRKEEKKGKKQLQSLAKLTAQVNGEQKQKKREKLSTSVIERLLSIGAKVKNIPQGYPSNCAARSNRHSATFKLRKLVKEMLANKTTFEEMKYNEAKEGLLPDLKKNIMF